jgi:hypothetical protein
MEDERAGHELLLPFDTDDPAFARGFEMGRLWALLQEQPDELEQLVHASNTEMVLRMAEATGRDAVGEPVDDVWTEVRFGAADG